MSHPQLTAAHPHHPAHYGGGLPTAYNPSPNPEGRAAIGAVLGVMVGGGVVGNGVSLLVLGKPKMEADVTAEGVTKSEFTTIMESEHKELAEEFKKWNRKRHAIKAVFAVAGAAVGAYIGAEKAVAARAATGAAVGTGAARAFNVAVNPPMGLPGVLLGALGAYYGAKSAR